MSRKLLFISCTFFLCCTNSEKKTSVSNENHLTKIGDENFKLFFRKFCLDSVFQIKRIEFPLAYITFNDEDFSDKSTFITKNKYNYNRFYFDTSCCDAYTQLYDNFEKKLRDSGERLLTITGIENGISTAYFFKNKEGLWYLVKIEDFST